MAGFHQESGDQASWHGEGEHRRYVRRGDQAGRSGDGHTAKASIAATCNGGSGALFGTGKLVEPIVGAATCEVLPFTYSLSGRLHIRQANGDFWEEFFRSSPAAVFHCQRITSIPGISSACL